MKEDLEDVQRVSREIDRAISQHKIQLRVVEEQQRAAAEMKDGPLQRLKLKSLDTARQKAEVGEAEVIALQSELDKLLQGPQRQQEQQGTQSHERTPLQQVPDLGFNIEDFNCSVSDCNFVILRRAKSLQCDDAYAPRERLVGLPPSGA